MAAVAKPKKLHRTVPRLLACPECEGTGAVAMFENMWAVWKALSMTEPRTVQVIADEAKVSLAGARSYLQQLGRIGFARQAAEGRRGGGTGRRGGTDNRQPALWLAGVDPAGPPPEETPSGSASGAKQ